MTKTENYSKLLNLVILDPKNPIWSKIRFFKWPYNPLSTIVLIWGRQNHVALEALHLKNRTKSDIKIKGFLKAEEISYNISKYGLSRTPVADLELF